MISFQVQRISFVKRKANSIEQQNCKDHKKRDRLLIFKMEIKLIELGPKWLTHRVISDRVLRLLVTLSYFRPDRFGQLLSLIPILILLLYLLVSGCLTSLC